MRVPYHITASVGALLLAVSFGGCDEGPSRTTLPTNTPPPPTPLPVTVTRLELSGPESVPPRDRAQFTVLAYRSDGSTRDVTNEAAWQVGDPEILTVSSTGVVTGRVTGESSLSASFEGQTATRSEVLVLPAGTYRVIGSVSDGGVPITGAKVAVTGGTARGLATPAGPEYRLYGLAGPTELLATRNGYEDQTRRIDIGGHQRVDFDLRPSGPRVDVSGSYTLEVSADRACRDSLPETARTRRYAATITQAGPWVTATLSGGFRTHGGRLRNMFSGMSEPGDVVMLELRPTAFLDYYHYSYPTLDDSDVIEEIAPNTLLVIAGWAQFKRSGSALVASLNGAFMVYDAALQRTATCFGGQLAFLR